MPRLNNEPNKPAKIPNIRKLKTSLPQDIDKSIKREFELSQLEISDLYTEWGISEKNR